MILLIDNYDSFVHNLARYLRRLGQETVVVRNDAITPDKILAQPPAAIVLSPGPCTPDEAGHSLDIVRRAAGRIPILGVCLGHQTIAQAFGGKVIRATQPMHGRTSQIVHGGGGIFAGVPSPFTVGRYHSLTVEANSLPFDLEITARTDDGIVMGLAHRRWPVFGVQFHPESILTEHGYQILSNFLRLAGLAVDSDAVSIASERSVETIAAPLPAGPVTF